MTIIISRAIYSPIKQALSAAIRLIFYMRSMVYRQIDGKMTTCPPNKLAVICVAAHPSTQAGFCNDKEGFCCYYWTGLDSFSDNPAGLSLMSVLVLVLVLVLRSRPE